MNAAGAPGEIFIEFVDEPAFAPGRQLDRKRHAFILHCAEKRIAGESVNLHDLLLSEDFALKIEAIAIHGPGSFAGLEGLKDP